MGDTVDTEELSITSRITGDIIVMLAAIGIGAQMFAAIFQPTQRVAHATGKPGQRDFLTI